MGGWGRPPQVVSPQMGEVKSLYNPVFVLNRSTSLCLGAPVGRPPATHINSLLITVEQLGNVNPTQN